MRPRAITRRQFQRWLAAAMLAPGVARPARASADPVRPRRLFYNNDGSFLLYTTPPLEAEEFVYEAIGRFIGTQVDAVICHMFGYGDAVPLYPTRVPDAAGVERQRYEFVSEWRQQTSMRAFWSQGVDPWRLALEAAHRAGIEYWAGMRFNDLHGAGYHWPSQFRARHPEYELGARCASGMHGPGSVYGERCTGLNYAIPAVRKQRLALVRETAERYPIDGFEWDFLREPGHYAPDFTSGRKLLTEYLREARAALDEVGAAQARRIGLGVRVPGTLAKCDAIGLDVEAWIRSGLLDYISPAPHWDTATELPFDAFVALKRDSRCRVLACTSEQVGPANYSRPPVEALRAGAFNAWRQGVDGIYIFNFHHHIGSELADATAILSEAGRPETLAYKDKLYVLGGCHDCLRQFPHGSTIFQAFDHPLPAPLPERTEGAGLTVNLTAGDDVDTARRRGLLERATLELILVGLTPLDEIEATLNGRMLPRPVEVRPADYRVGPTANEYQGNFRLRYDVSAPGWLRQGTNAVAVALRRRNPAISAPMVLHDLRLEIRYRILPLKLKEQ